MMEEVEGKDEVVSKCVGIYIRPRKDLVVPFVGDKQLNVSPTVRCSTVISGSEEI